MIAGTRLQSSCPYSIFLMAASFCDAIRSVKRYLYEREYELLPIRLAEAFAMVYPSTQVTW